MRVKFGPIQSHKRGVKILGVIAFAFLFFKSCQSCSDTKSSSPSESVVVNEPEIDTTAPAYVVKKLSHKKHLTKSERLELKEAKEGVENIELEAEAERNADQVASIKKDFEEKHMSGWDGSCPALVRYIKRYMNDPGSFEHVATYYAPDLGNNCMALTMQYRGKNAFGGLVLNAIDAKVSFDGEVLSASAAK